MKRRSFITAITTIFMVLGLLTFSQYLHLKPVSAHNAIHSSLIFEMTNDRRLIAASQNGLVSKINQSVEDSGITFTINDVYYFAGQISYSFTIETKRPISESDINNFHSSMDSPRIIFNHKLNFSGSTWFQQVTNTKYVGVETINSTKPLSKEGILKINYYRVLANKGKWAFHFPIKEVKGKEIKLSKAKSYKNYGLKIKTVKMNPAEIEVSFDLKQKMNEKHLWFNLLKEDGTALKVLDLYGGAGQKDIVEKRNTMTQRLVYKFSPPPSGVEKLTLSPYIEPDFHSLPKKTTTDLDVNQLPITVEQGDVGKLIVTNIEYKHGKILLYYIDKITFPYDYVLPGNNIWLESDSERNVSQRYIVSNLLGNTKPIGLDNSYVTEFDRPNYENQLLKIASRLYPLPKIIKELQIKIPF